MKHGFEYTTYTDDERLAILENRTAELLRRLEGVTPAAAPPEQHPAGHAPAGAPSAASSRGSGYADSGRGHPPDLADAHRGGSTRYRESRSAERSRARTSTHQDAPAAGYQERAAADFAEQARRYANAAGTDDSDVEAADYPDDHDDPYPERPAVSSARRVGRYAEVAAAGYRDAVTAAYAEPFDDGYPDPAAAGFAELAGEGYAGAGTGGYPATGPGGDGRPGGPGDRTERLINGGRRHARSGSRRRWRLIVVACVAAAAAAALIAVVLPGGGGNWPASVATVQTEITTACQNPNVVSEPSQVNFACAKDTQQILWVFALLTSYDNPHYSNASTGRKGLEPIQPAQGGNIAWSLNLHHPYNPASPIDSLEVAARAINNIIGGATVTGSNGKPEVQQGLESTAANCAAYTGSPALITRQGFPPICALPVNTVAGEAALVTAVFKQWMVGAPAQYAIEAGVLFQNAGNPGDPQVQSILSTLRTSGL